MLHEPLNLALIVHARYRPPPTRYDNDTMGSWFSDALHHITGTPTGKEQAAQVDQFRQSVITGVETQLAPVLTQAGAVTGASSSTPGALDSFLSANKTLLIAAGLGLGALMILKPKKPTATGGLSLSIAAPPPPPVKGK